MVRAVLLLMLLVLCGCATPVQRACEGKTDFAAMLVLGPTPLLLNALTGPDAKAANCVLASTDRATSLELALRFRTGIGAPKRPGIARHIYETLVVATGGTIYVYSPPVGAEKAGRTIAINSGPVVPGDARAMRELGKMLILGETGKPNLKQGWTWIRQAAAAGDAEAQALLKDLPKV